MAADTAAPALADERIIARYRSGNNLGPSDYESPGTGEPVMLLNDLEYFFDASFDREFQTRDLDKPFRECLSDDGNPQFVRIYYQRDADIAPWSPIYRDVPPEDGDDELVDDPNIIGSLPNEDACAVFQISLSKIKLDTLFGDATYGDVVDDMEPRDWLQAIVDTDQLSEPEHMRLQAFLIRAAEEDLQFAVRFGTQIPCPADTILLRHIDMTGEECGAMRAWLEEKKHYQQDPQDVAGMLQEINIREIDCTALAMGNMSAERFFDTALPGDNYNPMRADGTPLVPWLSIADPMDYDDSDNWLAILYAARHHREDGWEAIARIVLDEMGVEPEFPEELVELFHAMQYEEETTLRPGKLPHQRDPGNEAGGPAPSH